MAVLKRERKHEHPSAGKTRPPAALSRRDVDFGLVERSRDGQLPSFTMRAPLSRAVCVGTAGAGRLAPLRRPLVVL
jgi:hypothetical protein